VKSLGSGYIKKMRTSLEVPVAYDLHLGNDKVLMNEFIGSDIHLNFNGKIQCQHCGSATKKSYAQGYCYKCMISLAQCDQCIMSPEKCHFAAGTCREPQWGEENCFIDHVVYLANSSGLKVGITRHSQVPTRWIDQGAVQALPIFRVKSRYLSGMVETIFKSHAADKTDWRKMLKNEIVEMDLHVERDRLLALCQEELDALVNVHGISAIQLISDIAPVNIDYPVVQYPLKVSSLCFDKTPQISGKLMGIKGQYLILDKGVLNIRKYTSYHIEMLAA